MKTIVESLAWWWALPHELCHYSVAKWLGANPRLGSAYVEVRRPLAKWAGVAVLIAPTLFAVLMLAATWFGIGPLIDDSLLGQVVFRVLLAYWLSWFAGGVSDYLGILSYLGFFDWLESKLVKVPGE